MPAMGATMDLFADDAQVSNTVLYVFRNIVIAQKKDFQRKV